MKAVRPFLGLAAAALSLTLVGCPKADWDFTQASDAATASDAPSADVSSGSSSSRGGFDASPFRSDGGFHSDAASDGCMNNLICGCMSRNDCPPPNNGNDGVCDPNSHQCVECTDDGDCRSSTGTWVCLANTCVRKCDPSTPCGGGFTCGSGGGSFSFCQECIQSADCGFRQQQFCNPTTFRCVQCVDPNDCPPSPIGPVGCSIAGFCYVNLSNGGFSSTNHDP